MNPEMRFTRVVMKSKSKVLLKKRDWGEVGSVIPFEWRKWLFAIFYGLFIITVPPHIFVEYYA